MTDKHGQLFTGELKARNEDTMIIDGEIVSTLRYFLKFLSGVRLFAAKVSLVRHFLLGRFTACPGFSNQEPVYSMVNM